MAAKKSSSKSKSSSSSSSSKTTVEGVSTGDVYVANDGGKEYKVTSIDKKSGTAELKRTFKENKSNPAEEIVVPLDSLRNSDGWNEGEAS